MAGINARTTTATAMVVRPTANTTRPVTGAQLSLRSLGDASYAASSRMGAMKSASASSGGTVNPGAPGVKASNAPPRARKTGYGAPTRRAAAARTTAATKRIRSCSSSLIVARLENPNVSVGAPAQGVERQARQPEAHPVQRDSGSGVEIERGREHPPQRVVAAPCGQAGRTGRLRRQPLSQQLQRP